MGVIEALALAPAIVGSFYIGRVSGRITGMRLIADRNAAFLEEADDAKHAHLQEAQRQQARATRLNSHLAACESDLAACQQKLAAAEKALADERQEFAADAE